MNLLHVTIIVGQSSQSVTDVQYFTSIDPLSIWYHLATPYDAPMCSSEAAWRHPTQRTPHQQARRTQSFRPGRYASGRTQIASPQQPVQQRSELRSPGKDHSLRLGTVCWERQMKCICTQ